MAGVVQGLAKGLFEALSVSGRGAKAYGEVAMDLGRGVGTATKFALSDRNPIARTIKENPVRATKIGLNATLAVTALGVGGVGPFSALGEQYSRYATSRHGDRPETRRVIDAVQNVGIGAGVVLGATAGLGMFNKGPMAWSWSKAPSYSWEKGKAGVAGARKLYNKLPGINKENVQAAAKKVNANIGSAGDPWIMRNPLKAGLMLSAVGGVAAGVAESYVPESYGGYEGQIEGITNSKSASISPELQFSTNDLMFSLHKNNRSRRSRYQ